MMDDGDICDGQPPAGVKLTTGVLPGSPSARGLNAWPSHRGGEKKLINSFFYKLAQRKGFREGLAIFTHPHKRPSQLMQKFWSRSHFCCQ